MRTKFLFVFLSLFLVLGLSAPASADWVKDSQPADSLDQLCDIEWSKVIFFPPPNTQFDEDGETIAKYVKLGVVMEAGSSLPGIVQFNFDLDNNPDTGCHSSAEAFGRRLCRNYGFDLGISIILRDQTSASAIANPQYGGLTHALKGEWLALMTHWDPITEEQTMLTIDHGRLGGYCVNSDDLPNETCTEDRDCYKLPWRRIVENMLNHPERSWMNPDLDEQYVRTFCNSAPFEVLVMKDPVFADQDDYINMPGPTFHLVDIMPNPCAKYDTQCGNLMCMQFPQDDNQDWTDVFLFLDDWGRNADSNPCPACLPWP